MMATALAIATYIALAAFAARVISRMLIWGRGEEAPEPGDGKLSLEAAATGAWDVLTLRRLFLANPALWVGEWVFHLSFVLVAVWHMRYIFNSVPECVVLMQPVGRVAGYLLPISLVYILFVRYLGGRERYVSLYNLGLTLLIMAIGATGVTLTLWKRIDIMEAKQYVLGVFAFSVQPLPESVVFQAHYALALALVVTVPTHMFVAPMSTLTAREREKTRRGIMAGGHGG